MPRGFLVKRSRRPGGCYRLRPAGGPPTPSLKEASPVPPTLPELPQQQHPQQHRQEEREEPPPPSPQSDSPPLAAVWSAGSSDSGATATAAAAGQSERCFRSPASAESFQRTASEKLPPLPRTPLPLPLPVPLPLPAAPLCPAVALKRPPRAKAPPAKKPKAARKLSFADEVTTSPVLGLRIKAAAEGGAEGPPGGRLSLLGEFVCQLCKEPYADPLALAQHRCSRIVRVEYRCPECHKIFSCPANLASHRRWHKPRPPAPVGPAQGKENSGGEPGRDQHHGAADSACCRDPSAAARAAQLRPDGEAGPAGSPGLGAPSASSGEFFLCPYCHKTFRRQAYLRKHLRTHQAPGAAPAYSGSPPPPPHPPPPQQITFPCHLCGAHFPSADIRDKHRLWHAVREELLLPLGQPEGGVAAHVEQQIFSCKHCPSTFFSSPGLTRHINKCHPSENRQVLLLQMPVRPGC